MSTAYVILDRDGTIIADKHYLADPAGVELLPGAAEGLLRLQALGYRLAVVTNQSGIGRGYFSEEAMHAVNARMLELLSEHGVAIDGVFFCPHGPEDACDCRKPAPGLARQAAEALDIDLLGSVVVGDKPCDVELGRAVGAAAVLVLTGKGRKYAAAPDLGADYVAEDLGDLADWLGRRIVARP